MSGETREIGETLSPDAPSRPYDALLLLSFGGPEGPDDVLPFLENVVRGKNVPHERLLEVARHYEFFDGLSPINAHNRALLAALIDALNRMGPELPLYWGNLHWHPLLDDAVRQMGDDGVRHALALVTSAFGSPPGCRQYLQAIEQARHDAGRAAPKIDKLRLFYNHPGFIHPMAERTAAALEEIPPERRAAARLLFSAHSIPKAMAAQCSYEYQLGEACRLVVEHLALSGTVCPVWRLVYQSRSGPPSQPWLEPDIRADLKRLHAEGVSDVVVVPIGFVVEHMEIVYDLDIEASDLCDGLGINMVRAGVVAGHPRFVQMIRELVLERFDAAAPRLALGNDGPWPDICPPGCCLPLRP